MVIFVIDSSMKCENVVKNGHYNSPEPKETFSDCVFCHETAQKNFSLFILNYEEKQQILTFKKLEPVNV